MISPLGWLYFKYLFNVSVALTTLHNGESLNMNLLPSLISILEEVMFSFFFLGILVGGKFDDWLNWSTSWSIVSRICSALKVLNMQLDDWYILCFFFYFIIKVDVTTLHLQIILSAGASWCLCQTFWWDKVGRKNQKAVTKQRGEVGRMSQRVSSGCDGH